VNYTDNKHKIVESIYNVGSYPSMTYQYYRNEPCMG
jgi:hypothetical protein